MGRLLRIAAILVLVCISVAVVACDGEEEATPTPTVEAQEIKIGVIGPMEFLMGEHHWYGAQLAAQEINDAGGIVIGSDTYVITPVQVDSNELLDPTGAANAMERAITVNNVDFVMGGIRSEAVHAMQEVAMNYDTIFFGCGASDVGLCTKVTEDYDRYKYWFRVTPINSGYLGQVGFELLGMVAQEVVAELQAAPNVAILAEKAVWGDAIVSAAEANLPALGMEIAGVWRPSDTATDLTSELTGIESSGANIIFTALSGPVGVPYATQWGELEIPAASVGINVEAQSADFWDETGGKGDYECTMNIYAHGVAITDKTVPFIEAFVDEMGVIPTYNAGTYDAIYILKEAIETAGTLDADDLVVALEATEYMATAGKIVFTDSHDVTWGPGFVTALGVQWQDGELNAVWPPPDGSWNNVVYEGTVDYILPPWVVEYWMQGS
jgi:branched-chain amino acid transport system substrate-binding protein